MSTIFITGSADGLGLAAARALIAEGHTVTLHARSQTRAAEALAAAPGAAGALAGDLSVIDETCALADAANAVGHFDAVIHNAGIYNQPSRQRTADGLEPTFAVNVLAPYLLTAMMDRADRLIYLSSGLHRSGAPNLADLQGERRPWSGSQAYCDSKLLDVALALGVARHWPDVAANAVDPGWVATKMGGPGAPGDLEGGAATQVWLAGDPQTAQLSGGYYHHRLAQEPAELARDTDFQDQLLGSCAALSGIALSI